MPVLFRFVPPGWGGLFGVVRLETSGALCSFGVSFADEQAVGRSING